MDSYESDSSLEDTIENAETQVNLGYASKEPTGDPISHLGGFPTWLESTKPPSASLGRCLVCNNTMSLLLMLNADLPHHFPHDERRLHIFTCRRKQCSRKNGSIRALREVRKHRVEEPGKVQAQLPALPQEPGEATVDLGARLFGARGQAHIPADANSSSAFPSPLIATAKSPQSPQEPLIETFASKVRITTPAPLSQNDPLLEPWPPHLAFPEPLPHLHLDAEYEVLAPVAVPRTKAASSDPQFLEDEANSRNGSDKQVFESRLDKAFVKFSDRLAQNPEQVLRYEWKGSPLLYSKTDSVGQRLADSNPKLESDSGIPRCKSCGSQRVFEMQLVPGTINALEEQISLEEGMEWGTIILGVCMQNCGTMNEAVFSEEWCGVQWEETG